MWKWASKIDHVQIILMMIYSGVRPGELFGLRSADVNLEERSFWIRRGKNENAIRKVPIHPRTLPFFEHWMGKGRDHLLTQDNGKKFPFVTNHQQYTDTFWDPLLKHMGIFQYTNDKGDIKTHTPDDTRHTFTTMWREKKLDEAMRRKIQGHSGKGIGEVVYTHLDFEVLKKELDQL